jgi:NAD(P)-dependent dehydrogenase (short-subunit alcohol dehydrogenase family)
MPSSSSYKTLLLIGASRGLGYALAGEYLKRGWRIVATERSRATSQLRDLLEISDGRLEIETLDITHPDQVAALRGRLASRKFDMLFVNAGVATREPIADVSTEEFMRVMVTNALGPMRVVESFQDLVPSTGTIGIMSSGQGSITNNENGNYEIYRGSKTALNMFMRSFAARHAGPSVSGLPGPAGSVVIAMSCGEGGSTLIAADGDNMSNTAVSRRANT